MGPPDVSWGATRASQGHLVRASGSTLRHLSVLISEDGLCIADFAEFAFRLHESAICSISVSSWGHLGAMSGRLRPFWDDPGSTFALVGFP